MVHTPVKMEEDKTYVVIGGCGFLGRHIVELLLERGDKNVIVMDLRDSWKDDRFKFVQGDITDLASLKAGLKGVTTVIHTASPPHGKGYSLYHKVNVIGTENVIKACVANGVKQLVYTSSASVVFDGKDIKGGNEDNTHYCKKHLDGYTETKEKGERLVLAANGKGGLLTVALRPSGIFGPGDQQGWPGFIEAARNGKSKYQLGNGKNMMDWTYVENVALAHLNAADKLVEGNDKVAGQAFYITNDEPIPFWNMAKYIWRELDYPQPTIVVPYWLAYYLALIVDTLCWLLSPIVTIHPTFTFFRVAYAGAHRYFNIDKAKKHLGYKPRVSLEEGMQRTVKAFEHMRNDKVKGKSQSKKKE